MSTRALECGKALAAAAAILLATCKGSTEPAAVATTIAVSPGTVTLTSVGLTQQFAAAVLDQKGDTMRADTITWSSSATGVLAVSRTGLGTAVANGTAQVVAKSGGLTGQAAVTVAQAAAQVAKTSGDGQVGPVGYALAKPLAIQVNDANGYAVSGAGVSFTPTAASGSVTPATTTTNASGLAQATWTLGTVTGVSKDTVVAQAGALSVRFTATGYAPGPPANVVAYAGTNNQPGLVGYPVNARPAVLVTDASNNPVPNAVVTFAVASGGGSATRLVNTTSLSGVAQVGSWTLGATPAVNTMTATAGAATPFTFADTGAAGEFTIQVRFYGPVTPTGPEAAAFTYAATRWEQMIYRHFGPPTVVQDNAGECGVGEPALNDTITDVLIFASFDSIDGPNKTLAESGPCFVTTGTGPGSGLTVVGVMKFDTADVRPLISGGQLGAVVLHEMGHVLGFGTLWDLIDVPPSYGFPPVNCLQDSSALPGPLADTYFSCSGGTAYAAAEFDSLGGTRYTGAGQPYGGHKIPVENCANAPYTYPTCGLGTVNSHWRTTVFGNELMVGFLPSSPALSAVTVASLQDLGYTVNYAGADPYVHTFNAPPAVGGTRIFLGDDIHHGPLYAIDRSGRISLVRRRQ